MSDLKFPFKFKHHANHTVYTAELSKIDGYDITVSWGKHYGQSKGYTLMDIENLVESGTWVILKEVSTDSDPNVTIKQSELDALIDEINMLRECVADMNKLLEEKLKENTAPTFKPISEMTMEDWKQAKKEGWVFEDADGCKEEVSYVEGDKVFLRGYYSGFYFDGRHSLYPKNTYLVKRIQ